MQGTNISSCQITSSNGGTDIQIGEWQLFGDLYFDQYYQDFIQTGSLTAEGMNATELSKINDNNPELIPILNLQNYQW